MIRTVIVGLAVVGLIGFASPMFADLEDARELIRQGRSEEALESLEAFLATNPSDPEALFLRGLTLAEGQNHQDQGEAMAIYEQLVETQPDRPEPLNNLAVLQAASGEYEDAVETLKAALRTHPAYRTIYDNMTKIYGQLASEAYSRALNVEQAHERSAVELILLSEMAIERPEIPMMASADTKAKDVAQPVSSTPSPPLGAMNSTSAAGVETRDDGPNAAPDEPDTSITPNDAIAEVLSGDGEDRPADGYETATDPPTVVVDETDSVEEPVIPRVDEIPVGQSALSGELPQPADLASLVEAWAKAWSDQRVDDYLYFYSQDFVPDSELSRSEWETQRRDRLLVPEFINVSVAFLDFELDAEDRASVRFNQSYESDAFSDVVTKTLQLKREGGMWKIAKEFVDS